MKETRLKEIQLEDAEAQNVIKGTSKQFFKAAPGLYRLSSESNPAVLYEIANYYLNGYVVPQNKELGNQFMQQAAALGNEKAKQQLGNPANVKPIPDFFKMKTQFRMDLRKKLEGHPYPYTFGVNAGLMENEGEEL